ncbi:hypothetical protein MVEN_01568600 [Mycena venus]|uniref:Uncharacterized protein n=1 Tax=Mycena venus TaxID=2733690 RepID=A0A8H6XS99_9AGAR|nr:hypothetical protein MVEN_01568600 [Mycena venus]
MAAIDNNSYAIAFPTTDKNYQPAPRPRPPHLPFRRISLPTNPRHRESVVSVASFDSLPEEGDSPSTPSIPVVMRNVNPANQRKSKVRPTSSNRRAGKQLDAREAKRRKVIQEFFETEKAYVDGLELIYSHFLTPIIASLETPQPLLQRSDLASVFSNFVDIWNLHRAFFASLSDMLSGSPDADPPPLSPVLLSHFPYLSLYNPFVTAFPSTISSMSNLASPPSANHPNPHYSPAFAAYLLAQEADPRCGKLKLRDWLLTIVQRCPRYLLLLKDLIECTDPDDPEHAQLTAVHALVSKITLTLNTSIHTHAQTLSLLALQRATPSLPFQLIVPGRSLVRRGPLSHVELSAPPRDREFLLFSDCLVWLEAEDGGSWVTGNSSEWVGGGSSSATPSPMSESASPARPPMTRTRSKSEAELPLRSVLLSGENSTPSPSSPTRSSVLPLPPAPRKSAYHHPVSRMKRRRHASSGAGEEGRWVYKGRAELVDLEVVVTPPREFGEERRFEVLSPGGSFVLYADSEEERDAWTSAIRQTKAQLFVSLNATHPDSTLTSSSSTAHLRRSLQALPFPPSDERLTTLREGKGHGKGKKLERRGRVEHWVPAIWIPDEKTEGCMRCGRTFGWRRRRHHCRLCGRCVCASCSERTFFITDPNARDGSSVSSKPARACNACYETVFPLLDNPAEDEDGQASAAADSSEPTLDAAHSIGTLSSLSNFPSWLSMPSLPLASTTEALMAIDRGGAQQQRQQAAKYERLRRGDAEPSDFDGMHPEEGSEMQYVEMAGRERVRVMRSPPPRPRSYVQILEDFEESENGTARGFAAVQEDADEDATDSGGSRANSRPQTVVVNLEDDFVLPRRKEDTARRNKRFSLPAVALQTTSVTARTQAPVQEGKRDGRASRTKRFSLVLGTRHHQHHPSKAQSEMVGRGRIEEEDPEAQGGAEPELAKGVAAGEAE